MRVGGILSLATYMILHVCTIDRRNELVEAQDYIAPLQGMVLLIVLFHQSRFGMITTVGKQQPADTTKVDDTYANLQSIIGY